MCGVGFCRVELAHLPCGGSLVKLISPAHLPWGQVISRAHLPWWSSSRLQMFPNGAHLTCTPSLVGVCGAAQLTWARSVLEVLRRANLPGLVRLGDWPGWLGKLAIVPGLGWQAWKVGLTWLAIVFLFRRCFFKGGALDELPKAPRVCPERPKMCQRWPKKHQSHPGSPKRS